MFEITSVLSDISPYLLAGISGLCGWMWKSYLQDRAKDHAIETGLRTLLRAGLLEIHNRHVVGQEPISISIQDEAERAYRAYHELGGNGLGTMMWEQIMDLHAYTDAAANQLSKN